MKKTLNQVLSNLKPFAIYAASFLISMLIAVLVSEMVGFIMFYLIYVVLSVWSGFYTDLKKDKYGLIAFVAMIALSPIIYILFSETNNVIRTMGILGNAFLQLWSLSYADSFIIAYIFAIIAPILPIAIGLGVRKAINARKAKMV